MYRGIKIAGRYISTNRRGKDLIFTKSGIGGGRFSTFIRKFGGRMIADIKDIENFNPESDPLFDYVNEVADRFWAGFDPELSTTITSSVPMTFYERYVNGDIGGFSNEGIKDNHLKRYENNDIQNTLKAFNIDKEKFWYLCLCIKDYVVGLTKDAPKRNFTHREEILNLVTEMDEMKPEPIFYDSATGKILNGFQTQKNGMLTFQLDGSRNIIRITAPETISVINLALSLWLDEHPQVGNSFLDASPLDFEEKAETSPIKQLYWFHKFLSWFLKDKVADKEIVKELSTATNRVSVDKWLLISRMIYATGLSNKQQLNVDGIDYLKNYLKKCNDNNMKTGTLNNYYWN